jgi:hypothetical protein
MFENAVYELQKAFLPKLYFVQSSQFMFSAKSWTN